MKPAWIALCLLLPVAGCLGTGEGPADPPPKEPGTDRPKSPPDTLRGFALSDPFPKATYYVDPGFFDWKCTTTAIQTPFVKRGDTTFGKIDFRGKCFQQMGQSRYDTIREWSEEFGVAGERILGRDTAGSWVENLPWKPWQVEEPRDPWHPFDVATTDSLVRVEFLGDSAWAFARRHGPSWPGGIPTEVAYLYVQGYGPVHVHNRHSTTMHGWGSGEIIRLIGFGGFSEERIKSDVDRILSTVAVTPHP